MFSKKYNFIVSNYRNTWIDGAKRLFLADPYIYYILKKNGELKKYEEIKVAPYLRQTREDFERDHNFVDHKYRKYIPILTNRLNEIHGKDYDINFWKKCLSLGFLRYITFFYEMFQICETYLRSEQHYGQILSEGSYYIPISFDDHRQFFQHTHYGQEQIFSIYAYLYCQHQFATVNEKFHKEQQKISKMQSIIKKIFRLSPQKIRRQSWSYISKLVSKIYSSREPTIGIMCTLFYERYLMELIVKSKGRIESMPLKTLFNFNTNIDWEERNILSNTKGGFDKFDNLFFTSLKYCMPKCFVEDFNQIASYYIDYFNKYNKLQFVVSETWIGNTYPSIALAILQTRGVKHIYNEHNCLGHQYLGCNQKYFSELCDYYVTLGWDDSDFPNLEKGASLFEWVLKGNYTKSIDILYVNSTATPKREEINAFYGQSAESAVKYIGFIRTFFRYLDNSTKRRIVFRGDLERATKTWLAYDLQYILGEHFAQLKAIDTQSESAKVLMLKSRLVIVDYKATAYLESMVMNIPTIFFWDPDKDYLDNKYNDFYAPLISEGICQTDPIEAAKFVEQIKDNPDEWWQSKLVQNAKNRFLSLNIGNPQIMIDYLTKLSVVPC